MSASFLALVTAISVFGESPAPEIVKLFPAKIGSFNQSGPIRPLELISSKSLSTSELSAVWSRAGESNYVSEKGERLLVQVVQLRRDADAYSMLTEAAEIIRESDRQGGLLVQNEVGTASFSAASTIAFFKGSHFVTISFGDHTKNTNIIPEFAVQFANQLGKGEGDIPPLVKHLPGGEESQKTARFFPGLRALNFGKLNQQVLSVIDGKGDADAVIANVGPGKVFIVEFNTPQLATENDQRIVAKIHELWNQGLPSPSAYKRVGNYSVFVFDVPDEQAAKRLIDEVKYEQVVQWLGDNPYLLKEAERRYVETTMGVFIAVVKASGVAFIACFAVGGLFGALLFQRRRKQQRAVEAFSDAGGMLRLNLDELSAQTDSARLLQERN